MFKNFISDLESIDALLNVPVSIIAKSRSFVTTVLTLTLLAFLLVWYVQYIWRRRYLYYYSWNIPGPFAFPFIGCTYLFLAAKTGDIMDTLMDMQKKYPEIGQMWFGPKLMFTVSKPEHIEKILTSQKALDKDDLYKFISCAVGEGLLTARGQKWKKHRKVIMPAFNQKILNNFQKIFARQGEIFTEHLHRQSGNKDLDLFKLLSNCTLDIICETACGINMNTQNSNSEFGHNLEKGMEIVTYRIFHIWHHLEFTWNWYPISKEYARCLKNFKDFTGTIVKKKLEAFNEKQSGKNSLANTTEDSTKSMAFLDLILENSNFTEDELREEVDIFIMGGTDTTAATLCSIFVILGMFPNVQQKIFEEMLDIMGPDRRPLPSDLPHLKYTEMVIKETLRLFPVASFFVRKIAEDIEAGDMVFPAGSSAFFGSVHIHRNPKYWPDPLKFDPDRFLPENVAKRHPCTYIPFSYGPRNCIGGRYAMMNMKTILSIVVRKFKIFTKYKSIEDIKLKTNLVLRLKDGPQVWVECR